MLGTAALSYHRRSCTLPHARLLKADKIALPISAWLLAAQRPEAACQAVLQHPRRRLWRQLMQRCNVSWSERLSRIAFRCCEDDRTQLGVWQKVGQICSSYRRQAAGQ
jgi:hypothetical protein